MITLKKIALSVASVAVLASTLLAPMMSQAADISDNRYVLKTAFQGEGKCLEGNRFAPNSTLQGGAFMHDCLPFSGQVFKFEQSERPGLFLLKTDFMGDNYCLEGNRFDPSSTLKGAAFMARCTTPASGQLWWIEPFGHDYVLLKTLFQGKHKCLEGNRFDPSSTLSGAAFMANCDRPASGQLWKIEQL